MFGLFADPEDRTRDQNVMFGVAAVVAAIPYGLLVNKIGPQAVAWVMLGLVSIVVLVNRPSWLYRQTDLDTETEDMPELRFYDDQIHLIPTIVVDEDEDIGPLTKKTRLSFTWRVGADALAPVLIPVELALLMTIPVLRGNIVSEILMLLIAIFLTFWPFRRKTRESMRKAVQRFREARWILVGSIVLATLIILLAGQIFTLSLEPLIWAAEQAVWMISLLDSVQDVIVLVWILACIKFAFLIYAWNTETVTATKSRDKRSTFEYDLKQRMGVFFDKRNPTAFARQVTGAEPLAPITIFGIALPFTTLDLSYTGEQQPIPQIEGLPRKFLQEIGLEDPVNDK